MSAQELIIPNDASASAQNGFIEVSWNPIIASGFESYNIYRNDSLLANTLSVFWIDNETEPETGYCYNITSVYSDSQESNNSNTACAVWHINPPFNLEISAGDGYNDLSWETPSANLDDVWVSYDSGPTGYGVGSAEGPFEFDAAIRFTPQQLENMGATSSYYLTKIRFFPIEIIGCEFSVRVWTGGNADGGEYHAGYLLVDQLVPYPIEDEWNEIQLDNPVQVPLDQEVWIGYRIVYSLGPELYPAGTDSGPAVTGYGDLAYLPSTDTWYSLATTFGLNNNWNIQGLLTTSTESRILASDPLHYEIEIADAFELSAMQTDIGPTDPFTLIETVDGQINVWSEVSSRDFMSYDLYRNGQYFLNIDYDINNISDNNVENLDEYCYHLISVFDEGVSNSSDVICASPNPGDPVESVLLSNFGRAIKLIWESPDTDVDSYLIMRDGNSVGLTSATTFLDMDELYPGNNFCYEIQAVYPTGPTFSSDANCIDFELNVPYNINLSSGNGELALSWENEGVGIIEYNIYKDGYYYESSEVSPYVDAGAEEGIAHCYSVAGVYSNGVSAFSNEICGYPYIITENTENITVGFSNLFTLDMVPPQIDIYSPADGDHYPLDSNIDLQWYSEDESGFSEDAIDVYLSETLLPYAYYSLIEGLPNTGFALIATPNINTETAIIKLYSTDIFGNTSYAESFGHFSIGFKEFIDTLHVETGISDSFVIDQVEPEISWDYPNGGEIFDGSSYIYPQWTANDPSFDGSDIDIYFSSENGSEFDIRHENISYNTSLEFQLDNVSTSTALFKITAIDHYGNANEDTQDDFFSITGTEVSFTDTLHSEIGITEYFVIDQIIPEVEWMSPNGGEIYELAEIISTQWSAIDSSWDGSDATILLSPVSGGGYDTIAVDIPNTGQADIQLPDLDTESAQFSIYVIDHYGNSNEDYAEGFFTIGSLEDSFTDTMAVSEGITPDFIIDQVIPTIELISPNGGEKVDPYTDASIVWQASDDSWDGSDVNMWVMNKLGGWWAPIDTALSAVETPHIADLSEDLVGNEIEEELWGRMRLQAIDHFGNVGVYEYSDDYFILGDPEGEMESAYIGGNECVSLNWGWQGSHLITFTPGALSFLSNGDIVNIIDENAIINSFCDGGLGLMELTSFSYNTQYDLYPLAVKVYEGSDYCDQGGERYAGYVSGNPIIFHVEYAAGGTEILEPDFGSAYFTGEITVIEMFETTPYPTCSQDEVEDCSDDGDCCLSIMIGDGFADCEDQPRDCDLTCYENDGGDCGLDRSQTEKNINEQPTTISEYETIYLSPTSDGRDFNDYNIYRSTNAPINRDCGGNCGTCSDGLTFNQTDCEADGNIWTNLSWEVDEDECICLIAEHTQQTWYFDNFSMTQETWCYHVWLMDEETKLVKTVDSCLGIEILVGDVNGDGSVNILDVVSIVAYMTDQVDLSDESLIAADFNGDDNINVLDIVMMLEYILSTP